MANSNTTPPNVALDKIAQLLNNIVDESKLGRMWHCVVVFTQRNHVKMCSFKGTLREDLTDKADGEFIYYLSLEILHF